MAQNKIMKTTEKVNVEEDEENDGNSLVQRKPASHGLWTREGRLFIERFYFLNKSTTKYVIIGIDPVTFEVLIRICDRVTGSHVTITHNNFGNFITHLKSHACGRNNPGMAYSLDASELKEITIKNIHDLYWLSTGTDTVGLHFICVDNLIYIAKHLGMIMKEYTFVNRLYKEYINHLCAKTANMNNHQTLDFLFDELDNCRGQLINGHLLMDLVAHADYFITLPFYKEKLFSAQ
jgi:hypothetical protein